MPVIPHKGNNQDVLTVARNLENLTGNDQLSTQSLKSITANRLLQSDTNGKISASAALIANRVIATNASGLPVATGVTDTELASLSANATADTSTVPTNTDTLVGDIGGTIKQLSFARIWDYIKGRILGDNFIRVYKGSYYLPNRSNTYTYPQIVVNGFGFTLDFTSGWTLKVSHSSSPSNISVIRTEGQSGNNVSTSLLVISNGGQVAAFPTTTGQVSYVAEGTVCLYSDTSVHLNYRLICYNPTGSTTGALLSYW